MFLCKAASFLTVFLLNCDTNAYLSLVEMFAGISKSFDIIHCKLVGVFLCSLMFAVLCSKMMVKLVENNKGVAKFFSVFHVDCFGFRNITPNVFAMFLGHPNFQVRNINFVKFAERFKSSFSIPHQNHLNNFCFEQLFIVWQRAPTL